MTSSLATRTHALVLDGFDDPALSASSWSQLAAASSAPVFMSSEWQRAWWKSFGRGKLLLTVLRREGDIAVVAPLFAENGMLFFVGSGGSDYLDLIGDVPDSQALAEMVGTAIDATSDFVGARLYHVPESSRLTALLPAAAESLGLALVAEGSFAAPAVALDGGSDPARRKSLLRHENWFRRSGDLRVHHFDDGESAAAFLEGFFAQHVDRWAATDAPSLFLDPAQRRFYEEVCLHVLPGGWLRFTVIEWDERPIAFHFGMSHRGSYLWYKPTFAFDLAPRSPGEVLLRQLFLAAIAEGAAEFDFGLGEEPFKLRFATHRKVVRTWGLYPPEVLS